jgi:hypothetical protein
MMLASDGPSMFFPDSMEWQAWHFLKTNRPAEASPGAIVLETAVVALAGDGGFDAGASDCPVVALGEGVLFAAMWSWTDGDGSATGAATTSFAAVRSGAEAATREDGATGTSGSFGVETALSCLADAGALLD